MSAVFKLKSPCLFNTLLIFLVTNITSFRLEEIEDPKKNHQDGDEYDWGGNMVTHMLKQNSDGTLNPVIPPAIESTMKNECTLSPVKMTDTVKENDGSYKQPGYIS